jgi:arylamine N-acetyltransferase
MALERFKLSHEQLSAYFDRVSLAPTKRIFNVTTLDDTSKLAFLNLIQKHHLVKVPWENLTQHYSWHRTIHIEPRHLFRKIVQDPPGNARGGYCFEVNTFFFTVLYSLGFDVYMGGSRIYSPKTKKYGGWTHVINLVTINGAKYMLDGGYGGNGPCRPILVEDSKIVSHVEPAQMRLVHEAIPQHLDRSQRVWVCQHRYNENAEWIPIYCFTDTEFTPEDMVGLNLAPGTAKTTFFTHKVVAVRFTTEIESAEGHGPGSPGSKELEGEIDGSITLSHDTLKWRRHGKKTVDLKLENEQERLDALKKYFRIALTDEELEAIHGTSTELGVQWSV